MPERVRQKRRRSCSKECGSFQSWYGIYQDRSTSFAGKIGIAEDSGEGSQTLFLLGNEAMAFGALSAGARFMAAYPITPASEVMEYMVKKVKEFGGQMLQAEDEIAACTMTIGAFYGGARAFTATRTGFSLMAEATGLCGNDRNAAGHRPLQRGVSSSTGLPTKHEYKVGFVCCYL